jgi:hypothetical protein
MAYSAILCYRNHYFYKSIFLVTTSMPVMTFALKSSIRNFELVENVAKLARPRGIQNTLLKRTLHATSGQKKADRCD